MPAELRECFRRAEDALQSHRGWDPGALPLAKRFAAELHVPLFSATVSRLVVELNRSKHHPRLFSEFTRPLKPSVRSELLRKYWDPHRERVRQHIDSLIATGKMVVHLSVHTFTEVFDGDVRTTDIGLLYDPRRPLEKELCHLWRNQLRRVNGDWEIRRNDPYKGGSDGFTTYLRTQFDPRKYLGIELEVCQKFFLKGGENWDEILLKIPPGFTSALTEFCSKSL